jgi:hypothetical protein
MRADRPRRWRAAAALSAIQALGLALRLVGIGYGLPAVHNPDEVAIMNRALGFAKGDLNPHNFLYPTLYFYVLFVWEGLAFVVARVAGVTASLAAFEQSYFVDPSFIFLAGRTLTALLGVATVAATAAFGRRLDGRAAGLAAAGLLAVAPLAVRDAHYVKHDVPVTVLIVLVHVVLARALLGSPDAAERKGPWLLAGALAGLAMSTHYYAICLAVPLGLSAVTTTRPGDPLHARLARLAWAAGACALAFAVASPFLFVEPATALRDILANRQIVVDRLTARTGAFGALPFYVGWLGHNAMGRLAAATAAAGLGMIVRSGWRRALLVLAFPVAFLLLIANTVPASRYLVPLLPFGALLGGALIGRGIERRGAWRVAAVTLLAASTVEAGWASASIDAFFRQTDTRSLAAAWFEQRMPPGTSVLVQPYSVQLRRSHDSLVEALTAHLGSPDRASIRFQRELAVDVRPPAYRVLYLGRGGLDVDKLYIDPAAIAPGGTVAPLRAQRITAVILKQYNVPDPAMAALTQALRRGGRLLARFSPYRDGIDPARQAAVPPFQHNGDARIDSALERPGPIIEIWTIE